MSFINQDAEICAISEVTSILIIYFLHISKDTLGNLGNLFLAKAKKKKKNQEWWWKRQIYLPLFHKNKYKSSFVVAVVPLMDIFPNPKFKNLSCES